MPASVHFQSQKQDWATPDELYERLNGIYAFDLDVAASRENARCPRYFDASTDGLTQPWRGRVWCNPPYGRSIGKWVEKAAAEAAISAQLIVMLVPSRTDTRWWHDATRTARIEFLRGRLKFKGAPASAPFPSALLYWNC